jgi:hypothetical protein
MKLFLVMLLLSISILANATNIPSTPYQRDMTVFRVFNGVWSQVVSATAKISKGLMISNSSSHTLKIGTGAAGSETSLIYVPVSVAPVYYPIALSQSSRLSVIAPFSEVCDGRLTVSVVYN